MWVCVCVSIDICVCLGECLGVCEGVCLCEHSNCVCGCVCVCRWEKQCHQSFVYLKFKFARGCFGSGVLVSLSSQQLDFTVLSFFNKMKWETGRQKDREIEKQSGTERQRDRETERQRSRVGQRDSKRHTERPKQFKKDWGVRVKTNQGQKLKSWWFQIERYKKECQDTKWKRELILHK